MLVIVSSKIYVGSRLIMSHYQSIIGKFFSYKSELQIPDASEKYTGASKEDIRRR